MKKRYDGKVVVRRGLRAARDRDDALDDHRITVRETEEPRPGREAAGFRGWRVADPR